MHDEQRDMTRAAVSSYSKAEVKSFCSRFQSQSKWSSQKQPWIEQFWCWLSFVKSVSCSCVGEWWSTHLYVSLLVCLLIANARVDRKRNLSLSFHSYWEREKMLNYLTDCTGDQYARMKLWNQMKRGETKPNPTALSPRAVLMLSLTLNPSVLSTEREKKSSFIHRNLGLLLCRCVYFLFFVGW